MNPGQCGSCTACCAGWIESKATFATWRNWRVVRATATATEVPPKRLEWLKGFAKKSKLPLLACEYTGDDGKFTGKSIRGFGPQEFTGAVSRTSVQS